MANYANEADLRGFMMSPEEAERDRQYELQNPMMRQELEAEMLRGGNAIQREALQSYHTQMYGAGGAKSRAAVAETTPTAGIPIDSPEAQALLAQVPKKQGALSKALGTTETTAGPLSAVSQPEPRQQVDIAEMLSKFVPQDDSSAKYLALASALGKPTGFGTFGEVAANVADAMLEQKMNQQKLRAQYTPLIMQQIAAQQTREEQNMYRLEAQKQAQAAAAAAAAVAQQGRVDLAAQNQAAANERAQAAVASREAIAADTRAGRELTKRGQDKAPAGYAWGPTGEDGQPTMVPVKGGPADMKIAGQLNTDTNALNGSISSLDRLAAAANEVMTHPGLPGITGWKGAVPNVWGSDAANAEALLKTLKSQVGFGVLQDMRNSSKTGGALGNVSDKEVGFLQANLAALEKAQSLEQFQKSLAKIVSYTEDAKDRMREAYNVKHKDKTESAPGKAPALPSQDAIAAEIARRKKGS